METEQKTSERILQFIKQYMETNFNIRPTTREIATGIGLTKTSTGTVNYHINTLEIDGRVKRYKGADGKIKSRNILIQGIDY